DVLPAVELVPVRRRQLEEIDLVPEELLLLARARAEDHRREPIAVAFDDDLVDLVRVRLGIEGDRQLLEVVDDVAHEGLSDVALNVVEDQTGSVALHANRAEGPDLVPQAHLAGHVPQQVGLVQEVEVPAQVRVLDPWSRRYRHDSSSFLDRYI